MEAKGEAALVTGGASGLGRATAAALAAAGARVALLDRNAELAEETASEIGALAVPCDVTSEDGVASAIAAAREAHGIARICINCAGVGGSQRIVDRNGRRLPFENYKRIVDICLFGSFNMLSQAAEDMAKLEPADGEGLRGVVVNTASVAGYEGQIGQIAYASAKAGIVGMTLPAARDLASPGACACAPSRPASWTRRCSPACRTRRWTCSASRCPSRSAPAATANSPPSSWRSSATTT